VKILSVREEKLKADRNAQTNESNPAVSRTRRNLLQSAAWIIAGAMLPLKGAVATEAVSAVMTTLSNYMSAACSRLLPGDVIEKAKHHILDTFAAMISGADLPPGRAAMRFAQAYGGDQTATVIASSLRCGAVEAALVNGMLAHSDETDDSHAWSRCHPGCAIIPAAFAAAEQFRIDGAHFLRAVTLGYDIGTRVTMTLGGLDFQTKEHKSTYSFAGIFGAAAAAGCAANLDVQEMRWLLDYSAQQASGIAAWQRDTEHIEKAFVYGGMPARSGVTSALLVKSGWTGIDDIFSGPDNFLLAYAPQANPSGLVDALGERYEITRTNIKKWTVGSPIQAPLDALEILIKRRSFEAAQVREVTVRLANTEGSIVNNRDMPDVCLQHMIAIMLLDKNVSFRSAHDKSRMMDPTVQRAREKVHLILDEELERRLPKREAVVEITFTDGEKISERVVAVRGSAENPMPRDEVVAKCRDLISPVLEEATCTKLIESVIGLEKIKDVRELRPLLQRA
jgi:2-methylcitrate dehydratase PrpD